MEYTPIFPIAGQKFSRYLDVYLSFFCGISKSLCIYSTISLETPNGVLCNPEVPRNPDQETLR